MTTLHDEGQAPRMGYNAGGQPVNVNVTPNFGDTICNIEPADGPSHSFVHAGIINLRVGSPFTVTFTAAAGLTFDTIDPIWCSQVQCPSTPSQDSQIAVVSCSPTTLVINANPTAPPNAVYFSLNWSNGDHCDPIIVNH